MALKDIKPEKIFQVSLISLLVITAISWILNKFSPDIQFLKTGWIFLLFGIVILLVTLFNLGMEITSIKVRDVIFMFLVLAILVLVYLLLPQIIPNLFSIVPGENIENGIREFFIKNLGSVLNTGTGVV